MSDFQKTVENILSDTDKSNWETFKFSDIAFNVSERVEPALTNAEVYVGLEHIDSNSIHIRRHGKPSDVKGTKLKVYKGDIIFGKRRAYQRKAAVAEFDGICSAHAMVLRANPDIIDPALFPFFMHSNTFMVRALEISEGSLSPTIKWNILKNEEFKLPNKEIQRKLADLLWSIDKAKETTQEALLNLSSYRDSYLESEIFSKKGNRLFFKDLGEVIRGVGYKPEDVGNENSDNSYPILRSNNIQEKGLVFDDLNYINKTRIKEKQLLNSGDIVICMSNGTKELVGKTSVFSGYKRPISFGSFCAAYRPYESEYRWLIRYIFKSHNYKKQISLLLTGSNINNLKPSDIESISFQLPSKANFKEEKKVLAQIDKTEEEISLYLDNMTKLSQSIVNRV